MTVFFEKTSRQPAYLGANRPKRKNYGSIGVASPEALLRLAHPVGLAALEARVAGMPVEVGHRTFRRIVVLAEVDRGRDGIKLSDLMPVAAEVEWEKQPRLWRRTGM